MSGETALWSTPDGIRCVVRAYDDVRFQLKLLRPQGTIKVDLFFGFAATLAAAEEWLRQVIDMALRFESAPPDPVAR